MARLRFYFDEHIHSAVADALERRGVDVLTVQAATRRGFADKEQLAYALQQERVIVTQDSDYIALVASGQPHAGIAFAQPRASVAEVINSLLLLYDVLSAEEMQNHVEYL